MPMSKLLTETLQVFIESLAKTPIDGIASLEKAMAKYDHKLALLRQDFENITIDNEDVSPLIDQIFQTLEVRAVIRERYEHANITVLQFFLELREAGYQQNKLTNAFVQMIESRINNKNYLIGYIGAGLVILLSYLPPFFSAGGMSLLQGILAATAFIPIVGMVYTAGVAIYSFYQSINDKKKSWFGFFHDNFFLLAATALNVIAYSILIDAAVSMTPLAGLLFVIATAVYVVKEAISLVKISIQKKQLGPVSEDDSLEVKQHKTRALNDYTKVGNALAIELSSAAVMVGIIAFWSFVPGGIFVSIAAVAAIGLVYLGKSLALAYNERTMRTRLQLEFERIEAESSELLVVAPSAEDGHTVNFNVENSNRENYRQSIQHMLQSPESGIESQRIFVFVRKIRKTEPAELMSMSRICDTGTAVHR